MKIHLVTYASGRFEPSRRRLVQSAKKFGIDRSWNFSPKDFRSTEAYAAHPQIVRTHRGAGLWLWKPYYIAQVLNTLSDDDCLIYLDAGVEIIAPLDPLIRVCDENSGVALFKVHERLNRHWTKRDCFVLMDCDSSSYYDQEQSMSTIVVLRNNALARRILNEWFYCCSDVRVVSDNLNTCGLPNLPGFIEHRHDQSILNNLRIKYGLRAFTDPTQFGEPYRQQATAGLDDYPTLLSHHRGRLPSWRKGLKTLLDDPRKFACGVRLHSRALLRRLGL